MKAAPPKPKMPPKMLDIGQNNYVSCYSGYKSEGQPEMDVHRLGALCGPANGLQAAESVSTARPRSDADRRRVRVEKGACLRLAASTSSKMVEVEIRQGDQTLANCELRPLGWCPEHESLCLRPTLVGGMTNVTVTTRADATESDAGAASAQVSSQLWKRLTPKRRPPPLKQ